MALRQTRLKLLIAYSTVAQLGYLFLMFPLAAGAVVGSGVTLALSAGMFQAISHAFAKAAMFMAAGLVADAVGHDRIAELRGIGYQLPVTACAFGIAALSLIGVPPTGGFFTKWLLLSASVSTGQWWWIVVVLAGGLLAGGYMFRVISPGLAVAEIPLVFSSPVSRNREIIVLVLAILALLIGMMPGTPLELLQVGRAHLTRVALP
jgi:formate hydrogenlyase subunit 3/multisubunit Na+/H+ antiporter MnhD subunit